MDDQQFVSQLEDEFGTEFDLVRIDRGEWEQKCLTLTNL